MLLCAVFAFVILVRKEKKKNGMCVTNVAGAMQSIYFSLWCAHRIHFFFFKFTRSISVMYVIEVVFVHYIRRKILKWCLCDCVYSLNPQCIA
jgi:Na+/alanine symporter